jgi:hypothetical protein
VITAVPAATPVTSPALFTVAIEVLLLDQEPPAEEAVNVIVASSQTSTGPEMEMVFLAVTVKGDVAPETQE